MTKQVELLAPAGSYDSMKAAFNAGADAVYIGGRQFGARAYADNTTDEQLLSAIDYAHFYGKSLYLTVNTLVKEREMDSLYTWLKPLYEAGLDAVIVQDMGVFSLVRQWFPGMDIHASTQMTVTGPDGAGLLKKLGATRVVPARELSIRELKEIYDATGMEVEAFVHGALCYAYSGQCLLSSVIGGRSGNRGRCAQACRLPYTAYDSGGGKPLNSREEAFLLSLKDLCGLDVLPDMLDAGVFSLKIEGRMKSPQYTAGVTSVYRKYVDLYLEKGRKGYSVGEADRHILTTLFDRGGTTDGYLRGTTGRQMVALKEKPGLRVVDEQILDRINRDYLGDAPRQPVKGRAELYQGTAARLTIYGMDGLTVTAEGGMVDAAQRQPMTKENVEKQLRKTGNSPYCWEALDIDLGGNCFLPVQELNRLRRDGFQKLTETIVGRYRRVLSDSQAALPAPGQGMSINAISGAENRNQMSAEGSVPSLNVYLEDVAVLPELLKQGIADGYYLALETMESAVLRLTELTERIHRAGKAVYLTIPAVFQRRTREFLLSIKEQILSAEPDGLLVRTLDGLAFCQTHFPDIPLTADYSLYAYNKRAWDAILNLGVSRRVLPVELTFRELESVCAGQEELIAYGRLPVMISANCIRKTTAGCTRQPSIIWLRDRKGKRFPVRSHCGLCYNTVYNSSPLYLPDCAAGISRLHPSALRLMFTTEDQETIKQVVKAYDKVYKRGGRADYLIEDFTRGHYRRGME